MKKLKQSIIFFIFSIMFSAVSASDITKNEVMELISIIDEAIVDKNAEKLSSVFSNNVSLTLKVNMAGTSETFSMTKDEYISMVKEGWATSSNYKYLRTNIKVSVSGNSATVDANIVESMTMNIQGMDISMRGETKEHVTIKLINNTPLITNLDADSNMNISPL